MAYLALTGLDRAAGRLLSAGLAGGPRRASGSARCSRAHRRDLAKRAGVNLDRDVLPLFRGEVALWLAPAVPAPMLTLIARTRDENGTRLAFSKLQTPLAKLFGPGRSPAPARRPFEERDIGGGTRRSRCASRRASSSTTPSSTASS